MFSYTKLILSLFSALFALDCAPAMADHLRQLQAQAGYHGRAHWGHWGPRPDLYSNWDYHTNRLVPVYTFGVDLKAYRGKKSVYRKKSSLLQLYGRLPQGTLNPSANYFDQTQLYDLQRAALAQGKRYFFLVIFDGMDWQTTRAAAIHQSGKFSYSEGRGSGLSFQDYRGVEGDFGYMITAPHSTGAVPDPNTQTVALAGGNRNGGYHPELGGAAPWSRPRSATYLTGTHAFWDHPVTDSAAAATAMNSGAKTNNGAINVTVTGTATMPIARYLQQAHGFSVGAVTSVPISHATPACTYANNVTRHDYQDLTRDLLGLSSISHPRAPLPGLDVLIGAGWGVNFARDPDQGTNFVAGNRFLTAIDKKRIAGEYQTAYRQTGVSGAKVLAEAAAAAVLRKRRLFGFFGTAHAHLPFQTADGQFDPVKSIRDVEHYTPSERLENPTLSTMTEAAIRVLEQNRRGFWLMVEAGDVDWANHDHNIDNSVGAVLSGASAFDRITDWVEHNSAWKETVVIVAADHGHLLFLRDPKALIDPASYTDPTPKNR